MQDVIVIGGGLAGLLTSIQLRRHGVSVTLIEKKSYPFHRVCGEYISNEVVPYLRSLGAYPDALQPALVTRFRLSSVNGRVAEMPLDLGGFGISRFAYDHFLSKLAVGNGVTLKEGTEVTALRFDGNLFSVSIPAGELSARVVVAAYGKRTRLDQQLHRSFMERRSPYLGVKYHLRYAAWPSDLIALHNFENGYCGISRVEGDTVNLCYLTHRDNLRSHGQISEMEREVLFRNPFIRQIFNEAEFLFDKPETINEISFETKAPVEQHILMAGDAAGMITPLCGNGMAIAIRSSAILSRLVSSFLLGEITRDQLEDHYRKAWSNAFSLRLRTGRLVQRLFGSASASNLAVNLARHVQPVARFLMKQTHGKPFE